MAGAPLSPSKQVESIFPAEIPVHSGARNVDFQRVHVTRSEEPANKEVRGVCRALLAATTMRTRYMAANVAHQERARPRPRARPRLQQPPKRCSEKTCIACSGLGNEARDPQHKERHRPDAASGGAVRAATGTPTPLSLPRH